MISWWAGFPVTDGRLTIWISKYFPLEFSEEKNRQQIRLYLIFTADIRRPKIGGEFGYRIGLGPSNCEATDKSYGIAGCPLLRYSPAFASTHCVCTRRDGQAEFTWMFGGGIPARKRLPIQSPTYSKPRWPTR